MTVGDLKAGLPRSRNWPGLGLAALCAFAATAALADAASGLTIHIDSGALGGLSQDGISSFTGVPYAAAPVGDRRWRPPVEPAAWTGVRDASAYGPDCMQNRPGWDPTQSRQPVSEDCLTLNVWAPSGRDKSS